MQMTLETLGQLERRLNVAVPLVQIEGEVQKRLARLAKTVKIAGFRPGKVPLKMVVQQYGPQVRSDVISDTVLASFNDAIREQNLRIAGQPRIEPKQADPATGDQLEFSAVFEVYPEVKLGDMSGIKINRPLAEVMPADVDSTIEILRKQRVRYDTVTRAARTGDRVVVDFTGKIDGVEFGGGQAKDFPIVIGDGRMLPEFDAALTGLSAGDSKTFDLVFPADYHGKEVAGRRAVFDMTMKSAAEPILPEVDTEFARNFGIASGTVADLRAEITANLQLELKRRVEGSLKEQVMQALHTTSDFVVPRSLVEQETQRLLERSVAELKNRGVAAERTQLTADTFRPTAQRLVSSGLIINEVVRQHQLQPSPEQVRALVEETAQSYEQPEAVVRWHYEQPERLNEYEMMAVERNVIEWALKQAQVVDSPTTFAALMEPAANR
jgi:trigger factor